MEYIVLETQDSVRLNNIRFLDVSSGYIAVADENQCLLFNTDGKLISKIGRKGRGPKEYRFTSQMKIVKDKVLLPDPVTHKIKFYSSMGNFITEIITLGEFSPNIYSRNWMPLTDTTFLVRIPSKTGKEPFRIALIDDWGETIRRYRNTSFFNRVEEGYGTTDVAAQFYRLDDSVYYKEMLNRYNMAGCW